MDDALEPEPSAPSSAQVNLTLADIVKIGTGVDFSMLKMKPKEGASKKDKSK